MATEYNIDRWLEICNTTLTNYINMEKRLTSNKKLSNFVLVYYSIFLIITTVTALYFENCYNSKLSEYFGIILSVILLAFSLINGNANYEQRITIITKAINDLKSLKRLNNTIDISLFKEKYDEIVDSVEFRDDIDFFNTVKSQCKEINMKWYKKLRNGVIDSNQSEKEKRLKKYLSEISPFLLQFKIIGIYSFKVIVLILPIIIMILCFVL